MALPLTFNWIPSRSARFGKSICFISVESIIKESDIFLGAIIKVLQ